MKSLPCDHCPDDTAAKYLLQDVETGDSGTFCTEHYAMHAMDIAQAYAQEMMQGNPEPSDESREVYDDPGPFPQINEAPESTGDESGNDSVPDGYSYEEMATPDESA